MMSSVHADAPEQTDVSLLLRTNSKPKEPVFRETVLLVL